MRGEPLANLEFEGDIIEWRGPPPYLFVPVPEEHVGEVRYAAHEASYGWGCVPVEAQAGDIDFTTSLFPRDGTYLLPIKVAVQRTAGIGLGDRINIRMLIYSR